MFLLSSRIYFGICPTIPVVRNVGQTLKRSCSTREKRHREKRGFRLVPLLARAVQGDNFLSLRAVTDRVAIHRRSSRFHNGLVGLRSAFTMAEILLSLTIIGVVAAITLPSLTGNINERTWNTQRKALYSRFSQAIALMPALNGYGTLKETTDSATGSTSVEDTAAETFVTAGLSKVLKINNICDNEHLDDCGIPKKMISMTGNKLDIPTKMSELSIKMTNMSYSHPGAGFTYTYSQLDTKAAAFETINGESMLVFYNPNCQAYLGEVSYSLQPKICANFIFDLNGSKGPNTIGKDIGVLTALYSTDSVVVSPQPYTKSVLTNTPFEEARRSCGDIEGSEYRLPNRAELASMFVNNSLFEVTGHNLMSLDFYDKDRIFVQSFNTGQVILMNITTGNGWYYRCVKRY